MVDSALKLKIVISNLEETFEKEKNNVESIHIDKTNRLIEIKFNNDSELKYKIIPFEAITSFEYNDVKLDPNFYKEIEKSMDY